MSEQKHWCYHPIEMGHIMLGAGWAKLVPTDENPATIEDCEAAVRRAVNMDHSHQVMVEALKEAREVITTAVELASESLRYFDASDHSTIKKIDWALDLADPKDPATS